MKTLYKSALVLCIMLATAASSRSAVHVITVQEFQFSPNSLNVTVGDTIIWQWINGFHTTTSLSIPAGATPWDSPIDPGSTTFEYVITEPGTYVYECVPHSGMMGGQIVATGTSGIGSLENLSSFTLSGNVISSTITVKYSLTKSGEVSLKIYDLTGRVAANLMNASAPAGETTSSYYVNLHSGIYLLEMTSGKNRITKKIVVN